MAECSYARCVQQRRNIRRELQRWTKNMVHIVGLERIAEELMGRRKWKLYQESMSRSYLQPLNNNVKTRTNQEEYHHHHHHQRHHHIRDIKQSASVEEEECHHRAEEADEHRHENTTPTLTSPATPDGARSDASPLPHQQRKEKENESLGDEEALKDWTPATKCYFCVDGKLDSEHSAHGVLSPRHSDSDSSDSHSDNETPPSLIPGLLNHHNNHHRQPVAPVANMTTIESVTSMAALAAAISGGNSPGTVAPHLPFLAPNLLSHNWYLANVAARSFLPEQRMAEGQQEARSGTGEQPLDLSKGAGSGPADHQPRMPNCVRLPTADTKHIFNCDSRAKPRMSAVAGRRTYTEDELQAALRDIQSGKLGTRRAAVIYGIPRSTLRNKVYKLAMERERESHINTSATPLKQLDEEEPMDDDKELSGAEEEKEVEKALHAPLADILRFSNMDIPPDTLKLILEKSKENPIQSLLLASQSLMPKSNDSKMDFEFIKRMMGADEMYKGATNGGGAPDAEKVTRPSPSNSAHKTSGYPETSKSESDPEEAASNVILKIPSFKPTTSAKNGSDLFARSSNNASPPATSDSNSPPILPKPNISYKDVKDVIAQSISQKFQQNHLDPMRRPPMIDMDYKRGAYTPPLTTGISVIKTADLQRQPFPHGMKHQHSQQQHHHHQQNSGGSGGKGTRPKRGKYRNYDRDSLVEAVRAVQRGEMSVHRAGSYYGVPHSTLEYKVKERHLMRPRKRDPKPNPVDEKIASLKQNDLRIANAQENKLKSGAMMKPPQKFPPTSPNGMKLQLFEPGMSSFPGYNAPFPIWPHPGFHPLQMAEYGRNHSAPGFQPSAPDFFASQMMQKLQEESRGRVEGNGGPGLAKSARQIAESLLDGSGSNGSFLDGIIRSSLEVPINDDKKEDKSIGMESMSNKALLEQLCRNSRLTPLPKPNTSEPNSSGDESYRRGGSPLNFATGASNSKDGLQTDSSPSRYEREGADLHTIELSNDSNESLDSKANILKETTSPPPRIYLKKELANPDNFQPEMLVMRFRDTHPEAERNGDGMVGSASDNDAPQD